jgi:hypothetical protein
MSAGCSLDDAFPDAVPRLASQKKKRSTKGPALAFLKGVDSDPDRPFVGGVPEDAKPMKTKEGFQGQDDPTVDIIGQGQGQGQGQKDSYGHAVSSYFGKSETDESLSNFSPAVEDKTGYILNPVFPAKLPTFAGSGQAPDSLASSANANDGWKPIVSKKGGIETAFFPESSQVHGHGHVQGTPDEMEMKENMAMLRRQIDTLYARLESLEHRRGEFSHSELGLFIVTGLFLMFGLDTVRRFR